jgi:hypothetical protein
MHDVVELIEAERKLYELTGGWLSLEDEANALNLPRSELNISENAYREYRRAIGMELIVQGALRLAAHHSRAGRHGGLFNLLEDRRC